jgi:hypothetical protein
MMKMSKVTGFVREAAAMRIADVTRQHKKEGRRRAQALRTIQQTLIGRETPGWKMIG